MSEGELWFCWICRKPLKLSRRRMPSGVGAGSPGPWSTQFQVNGAWRDCHEDCYDEYSKGMPAMRKMKLDRARADEWETDA